ncbi:mercuric reductase, partial [mine drainage metagenome]
MEDFEYAILGQGSAAFAAAIKANELGIKTAMVGNNATKGAVLGGTCVNVGCVPSKRMITVASFLHEVKQNRFAGVNAKIDTVKYNEVVEEKDRLVEKFKSEKYKNVLDSLEDVTYIGELGSFIDKNTIKAGKREL